MPKTKVNNNIKLKSGGGLINDANGLSVANNLVIANGVSSITGSVTTVTLTHNLGYIPYLVEFDFNYYSDAGSGYVVLGIGSGRYVNSINTVNAFLYNSYGKTIYQLSDETHCIGGNLYQGGSGGWQTPIYASVTAISSTTITLTFTTTVSIHSFNVHWRAFASKI